MIDECYNGARYTVDKIKEFTASPLGVLLYSLVTGVIGIIILLGFISLVLSPSALTPILPVIIAFNGAASGYSLIDRGTINFPHRKSVLVLIAALLTITGCSVITLFCPWEPLFHPTRYLIVGLSTTVFTFFGAWIAVKSNNMNRSS